MITSEKRSNVSCDQSCDRLTFLPLQLEMQGGQDNEQNPVMSYKVYYSILMTQE